MEENADSPIPISWAWKTGFYILMLFLVASVVYSLLCGAFELANHLAAVITGIATVALVYATNQSVSLSKNLIEENKRARREAKQRRERDRERELEALRRGLLYEIQAGDDLEFFNENGVGTGKELRKPAPTTIYEQNTDRIGRLTDCEISAIVEYYSLVQKFEDQLYLRNETDRGSVFNTVITPAKIHSAEEKAVDAIKTQLEATDDQ
ncbi:hypothetical protein [Natrinema thermotolerans]